MEKELRILHIFGKMDRGGAEMRTLDMMKALGPKNQARRIQFDFLALSGEPGELDPVLRQLGGNVYFLRLGFGFIPKFRSLLRTRSYDVVHSHVHFFSGLLLKLAQGQNVPVRIAHLHTTGTPKPSLRRRVQNKIMLRWLFKYATDLIPVSQGAAEAFYAQAPRFVTDPRVQLIYDAIDIQNFQLSPTASESGNFSRPTGTTGAIGKAIIHVGRTDPVKNHEKILAVFARIASVDKTARLLLVGASSPLRQTRLVSLTRELGIVDRVSFLGSRDDVVKLLGHTDLMIFPSRFEGLPGAVMEAAALGVPVLGSDLPGCRELGQYFKAIHLLPSDAPDSTWSEKGLELLQNGRVDRAVALQTLRASPFHLEAALDRWIQIWNRGSSVQPKRSKQS